MRAVRAVTLSIFALALSACASAAPQPADAPLPALTAALPGPADAPPLPAREPARAPLPGVGDIALEGREAATFWQLVSQLYAPCAREAVSVRQCVEESRPCSACKPAARLLAQKVKEGLSVEEAREAYAIRFGPQTHQVDVAGSPTRGPADAPVTIMVWSDFECPHCRHAMPVLDRALDKHAPNVRLVHKMYPLSQHVNAKYAARAAIAAQAQGKYWEMEKTLFDHQSDLSESDVEKYAKELGLDMARFHRDVKAARTTKILERDHADAERCGLSATPFILINGRELRHEYFKLSADLDGWIETEIALAQKR
jgi:protein-disulfide isomerase